MKDINFQIRANENLENYEEGTFDPITYTTGFIDAVDDLKVKDAYKALMEIRRIAFTYKDWTDAESAIKEIIGELEVTDRVRSINQ